jgi:Protein of unknown function (DUF3500)
VPDHSHDDDHSHSHDGHHSRRAFLGSAAAIGAATSLPRLGWAAVPQVGDDMAKAAGAWLGRLDARRRNQAQLDWGNRRREDWHYVPRGRPGLTFRDMTPEQVAAAWDLLGSLLSARGISQVRGQLKIEGILGELSGSLSFRDPGNYALVVFGDPAVATAPWAWRFEGHHLSLTTTVAPGYGVAITPMFFGANPATVPARHQHAGFRLLGDEETAAFGLIGSLEGAVRSQAVIGDRSLGDIVSGPGRELTLQRAEGVPLARLNEAQRDGVMRILQLYAGTMREEIAAAQLTKVREASVGALHFAWAGSQTPGRPHYFRVHGPTALIEYDNTQDGANHVHSVWIDPQSVFGRDLLKAHYRGAH